MKREDVKEFNGENGKPAYIIFKGKVYDVTESRLWKNGKHMGRHKAGGDMTDFISMAPHDEKVLDKVKYVCDIEEDIPKKDPKEKWRNLYRRYHPHPIFIHFPMGVLYFGVFMLFLFLIFKISEFERTAYYALLFGGTSVFPAVITGLMSWYINYDRTLTEIFKNKIIYSSFLILLVINAVVARVLSGNQEEGNLWFYIYAISYLLAIPVMTFVAYNGGRITWPD
ncbi:DUF2231 domain-containing protein [Calditerrivibrio nitroreducens]|uniref:DUF2231 domain-containing protein n=1 Tax=Calditerrivibrio nitroreducens TaxID=477976 RepID=UPI003C76BAD1